MPRVTVGVDVGKGTHQAAGYDPAADRVVGRVTFPVSRAGFERFRLFLEQLAPELDDILVGLEATGHYHLALVEFLAEHGYAVLLINPYQAAAVPPLAGRQGEDRPHRRPRAGSVPRGERPDGHTPVERDVGGFAGTHRPLAGLEHPDSLERDRLAADAVEQPQPLAEQDRRERELVD